MLAYSSMENMGLIAVAAAAGTRLAVAALLLHVLAHGVGKTVLFLAGGQLQAAHGSTVIGDISAVLSRSRLIGVSFAAGIVVLLGLPPFAMFASEISIARSLADARLSWVLGAALVFMVVAFAALVSNSRRILLGTPDDHAPPIVVPAAVAGALLSGVAASLVLGVTAGPLTGLFRAAANQFGVG
jgi:hydrogenase-4 component F